MIKLLLHESKRRVGSPGVFITPGTYFILGLSEKNQISPCLDIMYIILSCSLSVCSDKSRLQSYFLTLAIQQVSMV